jgi:hypothetical protein
VVRRPFSAFVRSWNRSDPRPVFLRPFLSPKSAENIPSSVAAVLRCLSQNTAHASFIVTHLDASCGGCIYSFRGALVLYVFVP